MRWWRGERVSERPGERGKARARALSRRGNRKSRPLPLLRHGPRVGAPVAPTHQPGRAAPRMEHAVRSLGRAEPTRPQAREMARRGRGRGEKRGGQPSWPAAAAAACPLLLPSATHSHRGPGRPDAGATTPRPAISVGACPCVYPLAWGGGRGVAPRRHPGAAPSPPFEEARSATRRRASKKKASRPRPGRLAGFVARPSPPPLRHPPAPTDG